MKVLHLIDSGGVYGAERMVLALAQAQTALGHEPLIGTIVAPQDIGDPLGEEAIARGLPHRGFKMRDGLNLRGAAKFVDFADRSGIDVIHSHGYRANILMAIVRRADSSAARVGTLHGWTARRLFSRKGLYEAMERVACRRLDGAAAVSADMAIFGKPWRRPARISVIFNGIDVERSQPGAADRDLVQFMEGGACVLGVGRLSREKDFGRLLLAVSRVAEEVPELRVVILGEGPERKNLEVLSENLGIANDVALPGFVRDARQIMSRAAMCVVTSETEGMPITVLEAMAEGVPVVSTRVGSIPSMLDHGKCGVLIADKGGRDLERAIMLLVQDEARRCKLINAARARVVRTFSKESMASAYGALYERAISVRRRLYRVMP